MTQITTALDFFRSNECSVEFHGTCNNPMFTIVCKVRQIIILDNANEFMLKEFYLKCIN